MKKRELTELRKESVDSLVKKVKDLKLKALRAEVDRAGGKETNLAIVRNFKRDIAQVSSIISELERNTIKNQEVETEK